MNAPQVPSQPVIDFTDLPAPAPSNAEADYEPPRHVFFGRRDERGRMEKEPVYRHQSFPKMMYGAGPAGPRAMLIRDDREFKAAVKEGWHETPEALGLITAPSRDQILDMREQVAA